MHLVIMQPNGTKRILMMCYVIFLSCPVIAGEQTWTVEASDHNKMAQNRNEWTQMPTSRQQILQYISFLLELKQRPTDVTALDSFQPALEEDASDTYHIRFPAVRNQGQRAVKRQRPCFWSVVTCY